MYKCVIQTQPALLLEDATVDTTMCWLVSGLGLSSCCRHLGGVNDVAASTALSPELFFLGLNWPSCTVTDRLSEEYRFSQAKQMSKLIQYTDSATLLSYMSFNRTILMQTEREGSRGHMEVCSNKHSKHSMVHLRWTSWRLKVLHSCMNPSYTVGGIVQERAENSSFPLLLPAGYPDSGLWHSQQLFLNQFVEPAGIPCLDVTSPAHREQCTGHYVLVEVTEQSVANIGWHEPIRADSVYVCYQPGPSCSMIWTPITRLHILTMNWWHVSLASCSAKDHLTGYFTSQTFNVKTSSDTSPEFNYKILWCASMFYTVERFNTTEGLSSQLRLIDIHLGEGKTAHWV